MLKWMLIAACLAAPARAEQVGPMVASDLNGDGRAERFSLVDNDGSVDLVIENTGGGVVVAERIAWRGGVGQQPDLALAPNGSVLLTSRNAAIGRDRWHLTLTIAWRKGAYRVAGVTYGWVDTLDLEAWGNCDLNLLTGRGELEDRRGKSAVRTGLQAVPVTDWRDDVEMPPQGCR